MSEKLEKLEISVKGEVIYTTYVQPGTINGAMLPNILGDGRTLLLHGIIAGWFEPIRPEDELVIDHILVDAS